MQNSFSSHPAPKQIPFNQIRPIKFMGISNTLPFNSIISDSKLLYFSGRSIIIQNVKTYEQKPIWTNEFDNQPQVIEHFVNIHRQNIMGIAIRDNFQKHLVIIMNINSQINNYQHLNKKQSEKDRIHYLKHLTSEYTTVQKLNFLHQGSLFSVIVSHNSHKFSHPKSIFIHSSMSGQLLQSSEFSSQSPLIQPLQLNHQNYICIIKNQPEQNLNHKSLNSKKSFYDYKRLSSMRSANQSKSIQFFTINMINSSELTSKNQFLIQLNSGQLIIEVKFFQNHKKTFAFLLLNSGFLLIYMINERGFHDSVRIDVRIDKEKSAFAIKNQNIKTYSTQKTEQSEKEKSTQRHKNTQSGSFERQTEEQASGSNSKAGESEQDKRKQTQKTLKVPQSRQRLSSVKSVSSESSGSYLMPTCICCTNCKVVIGYEGCSFIGLMTYSAVDHRHWKFKFIDDFFSEKPHIQSIRKINFSEDGCHCGVLVKVDPFKVDALRKKKNYFKNQKTNQKNNKANTLELTQNDQLKTPSQQSKDVRYQYSKKSSMRGGKLSSKQLARIQKRAKIMNPKISGFLQGLREDSEDESQREHFALMQIDFISGMIEHEHHNDAIEQSMTSTSLNGLVELVEFNDMNNTMLVLMNDNRLYFYSLNPTRLQNDTEIPNCTKNNISLTNNKPETTEIYGQKQISNYLAPGSVLLWADRLKLKPFLLLCHPLMFELVLIFQDNLKFHFYNYDKIFEFHHVLNLKNCKAASFSPFGDKLALGTASNIWLVDSYTHSIIKKISLVIFPTQINSFSKTLSKTLHQKPQNDSARRSNSVFMSSSSKTVSRIQYINNDDLIIQTGNTTLSMLLNYEKVIYYGSTSEPIQPHLVSYDFKHRLSIVASDTTLKVITKCSINSKNKCQELAKIDLVITAMRLCGEIDILFLGGANGILYFIRWPQFFQNDTIKTPNINNKLHLFHCPIIDIRISINYHQLFVISQEGAMVICELVHSDEVDKIGKDVSYVMSKKIDLPLPLVNKWLISSSEEEKRAQNITKLMGNEAEIKNNEAILSDQYKKKLDKLSLIQKNELEQQLKNEIKQYEEDSGISKLLLQIVTVKDQIKRMNGKRQLEVKKINKEIDQDLHKLFVERQKLEKQFRQLKAQTSEQKTQLLTKNHKQLSGYKKLTQLQLEQDEKAKEQRQKMFQNKMKIDRALQENMIEDFMDERFQVQKIYTQQLADVYLKNNELNSLNRNKNVQISLITDKIRQLSARMYQLENDCNQLEHQNQQVIASKKTLSHQIQQTDKKYHALIKKTKQIEITLNKTRTSSEACQLKFNDLEKQMQILQEKWQYLELKRQQSEIDFTQQFKLRNFHITQTQQLKLKISQLKAKRKHSFQTNVLLKGLIKPYEKQSNSTNFSLTTDSEFNSCIDSSAIELKKIKTNKLTSDVNKWNNVKNDNKKKFIRYNQKLQEQNNKLVYRFNELQKEFKQLVKTQTHLKNQIFAQKQKESMKSGKWEKFSFVQKYDDKDLETNSKVSSISVHRPNASIDRLSMTCYNSTLKSLHRQNSWNEDLKKTNENFMKTGLIPKNILGESQMSNKLGKKGSKNLQNLIQEKRQLFKERNQNGQASYHGVTLDRETLKPKKTMCLSLHQEGQSSGKFITQY